MTYHSDLQGRLYGMMQALMTTAAGGGSKYPPASGERGVVTKQDALDAVIQLAARIDSVTQDSIVSVEYGKTMGAMLMIVREYIEPLPQGLAEAEGKDLLE